MSETDDNDDDLTDEEYDEYLAQGWGYCSNDDCGAPLPADGRCKQCGCY